MFGQRTTRVGQEPGAALACPGLIKERCRSAAAGAYASAATSEFPSDVPRSRRVEETRCRHQDFGLTPEPVRSFLHFIRLAFADEIDQRIKRTGLVTALAHADQRNEPIGRHAARHSDRRAREVIARRSL
jgi:hypothetical protein